MYESGESKMQELVHLYVDGAFSRRELIARLARYTGGVTAAIAALNSFDLAYAEEPGGSCAADASVPADVPDLNVSNITFQGETGDIFGHLAYPRTDTDQQSWPGVIVVHENRGLVEHIRDVTRRAARSGFVALGVDLLSRQGGTDQFTDPTQQTAAYGRTTQEQRRADLIAGFNYLKSLSIVKAGRIGAVGFCAGGGNVWDLAVNLEELAAAVAFYGTPVPAEDQIPHVKAPVLAIYAELDRALTIRMSAVMTAMLAQQKTFGFHVYQGAGHAFHNDTGPAYNAPAACDAWSRTLAWFNKFLPPPPPPVQS
jgi:carboxymethylenebutenolidase